MDRSIDEGQEPVPWFGARKMARRLATEVAQLKRELAESGAMTTREVEERREEFARERTAHAAHLEKVRAEAAAAVTAAEAQAERERAAQAASLEKLRSEAADALKVAEAQLQSLRTAIVKTEEAALLQEVGIYEYRHPLSDAVSYERELEGLQQEIKELVRADGGAVLATTDWQVNGSLSEGRKMVRDFSKLMLRAFNAEADNLVRGLKPYRLAAAKERLEKVASTIERLGKTMHIRISTPYLLLRERELELTADFLQKQAEEKEIERVERERLREERKVQKEIERERARLEKERQHYLNALEALTAKGDEAGAARLRDELGDVQRAIDDVDYRAANIRAGYVYVISNIGSFGERMVKVGMTRRLDPLDRIRELSDASVPFNFDTHALFFSKDAVGIELALHERLAGQRVNAINRRREFFQVTPAEVKTHLAALAGELLQFEDVPEALEYRQCLALARQSETSA